MSKCRRVKPYRRIRERIYGCSPLADDEALSSWIMLVSVAKKRSVCEILKMWNYEINDAYEADIARPIPPLSLMASATFESGIRLAKAHWAGDTVLGNPQFGCLTSYPNGSPIHLYCPTCLAGDQFPHIRWRWRLAYQFVCEAHHELLHDSCPHCRRRIHYLQYQSIRPKTSVSRFFRCCPFCGCDLTQARHVVPDSDIVGVLLSTQQNFHKLVTTPFYRHPSAGTVSSAKILESFLIANESRFGSTQANRGYREINLERLFLNRYLDVVSSLRLARKLKQLNYQNYGQIGN